MTHNMLDPRDHFKAAPDEFRAHRAYFYTPSGVDVLDRDITATELQQFESCGWSVDLRDADAFCIIPTNRPWGSQHP